MKTRLSLFPAVLVLAGALVGCGAMEDATGELGPGQQQQQLEFPNGLSLNGLSLNGLSLNGLSLNGLSLNGLATSTFSNWFTQDPALADEVMHYLVQCAVPAGQTRVYTSTSTGQTYTWQGNLGLAPDWADGAPATPLEQQLITACMMAHTNSAGHHLSVSLLGRSSSGALIPFTSDELSGFGEREACFFGNLFSQPELFFGMDRSTSGIRTRACKSSSSSSNACAPLFFIGECQWFCKRDPAGPFYESCTIDGVTYPALTTRMRQEDYQSL